MRKNITILIAAMIAVSLLKTDCAAFEVSAASAVLINADTGTVIYARNADTQRAMASTTKIMTALLTLEAGELDKRFRVDPYAIKVEGTSMGLREGDIVTRYALCCGMLLPSGNDAANAAAVNISGSIDAFCELMNKRAEQIGMRNSHFASPSGLDTDGHYSTAYDMALLAAEAIKNPMFRDICSMTSTKVSFGNPPYERWLSNSNKLLKLYDGCFGVKTGFTDNARRCLVSAAERDGVRLIAVTLNAPDDWNDHTRMLDYGFTRITSYSVSAELDELTIPVVGGAIDAVPVKSGAISLSLSEEERASLETKLYFKPFLYGGFNAGDSVGKAVFSLNGNVIGECGLFTAQSCAAAEYELNTLDRIGMLFGRYF